MFYNQAIKDISKISLRLLFFNEFLGHFISKDFFLNFFQQTHTGAKFSVFKNCIEVNFFQRTYFLI